MGKNRKKTMGMDVRGEAMEKIILFGAGKICLRVFMRKKNNIIAVIDNDSRKWGMKIAENTPIISIQEYLEKYKDIPIWITSVYATEIVKQLNFYNIYKYSFPIELWKQDDVPFDEEIAHGNWPYYLKKLCDKPDAEILELGSRRVNQNDRWNEYFEYSNYTGFDYYPGENVNIVGDVHKLGKYFDKKFDLIFSSAVFEHLAMPWKVALEIIKLLNLGGYVFIETHYSFGSHERPWHFFQYSENALNILFPSKFGMKCIKKGCSNLIEGRFSEEASPYLKGKIVSGLYCHSEFLAQKVAEIPENELSWDRINLEEVTEGTQYPII